MISIGMKRAMRRAIDPQMSMARFRTRALPTVQFQASILNELPKNERRLRGMIFTRKPFCCGRLLFDAREDMTAFEVEGWLWRDIGNVRLTFLNFVML